MTKNPIKSIQVREWTESAYRPCPPQVFHDTPVSKWAHSKCDRSTERQQYFIFIITINAWYNMTS